MEEQFGLSNDLPIEEDLSQAMSIWPGEIAVRGVAIYRERTQQLGEPIKKRCYVVIDVETGDYEIDAGDAAAAKRLLGRRPGAVTYAVRVGYRAAYSHVEGLRAPKADD